MDIRIQEEDIKKHLIGQLNPAYIILFGSFAKNTNHEESDIDLAFYPKEGSVPPKPYELFTIAQDLAYILKFEVDLVNLKSASTVFKAQIYSTGYLIYAEDRFMFEKHQMTALSMYAKLNEERKSILERIDESGTIYEK
ncbi:type VII toxin-antitoxin system MntA family adenylyltransferase antitoxin [Geomicrobium sediminis]|uniref:Nucleotidyltransferase n=1 Tax=Geomicrobium sediminis TaxID=1347788 RepID=A0ABS2PG02_9BACL|nr:nucleotidyltransferase domain-containing protein [Geomicrobium sediminis]MBM7634182.1 putative nucleotidyltransferase [Geomicrobium sediminis]